MDMVLQKILTKQKNGMIMQQNKDMKNQEQK